MLDSYIVNDDVGVPASVQCNDFSFALRLRILINFTSLFNLDGLLVSSCKN